MQLIGHISIDCKTLARWSLLLRLGIFIHRAFDMALKDVINTAMEQVDAQHVCVLGGLW